MAEPVSASTAATVGLSVKVLEMVAPKGLQKVSTWFRGVELLILGQARAGKTTFIDYLRHGELDDKGAIEKTLRKEVSPMFQIKLGRNESLELKARRAVDIPGQVGAVEHANLAYERNPQAIIVFLDVTRQLSGPSDRGSLTWLEEFVDRLEWFWCVEGKSRRSRLKSFTVVVNKIDLADTQQLEENRSRYRAVLDRLKQARGTKVKRIRIMPCVAVSNSGGSKLIDAVITSIAKDIAG